MLLRCVGQGCLDRERRARIYDTTSTEQCGRVWTVNLEHKQQESITHYSTTLASDDWRRCVFLAKYDSPARHPIHCLSRKPSAAAQVGYYNRACFFLVSKCIVFQPCTHKDTAYPEVRFKQGFDPSSKTQSLGDRRWELISQYQYEDRKLSQDYWLC